MSESRVKVLWTMCLGWINAFWRKIPWTMTFWTRVVGIIVLLATLGFSVWLARGLGLGLLPMTLAVAFCAADVLVFLSKPKTVKVGGEERTRVFSPNLRLIALGAFIGLAIVGLQFLGEAFGKSVPPAGSGAVEDATEWRWVLRLLAAVLFTGLIALGILRLAKED